MIIFPAIDLLDGSCVRLQKGVYESAGKVAEDPLKTAKGFEAVGAEYLHMVDLDGAKNGEGCRKNRAAVARIVAECGMPVELGGGIRTIKDIEDTLACGVTRVILGSAATDLDFLARAVSRFGERVVLGIDAKNGYVATAGWLKDSGLYYLDFAKTACEIGIKTIIFTDISRDGMLTGPNLDMLAALQSAVPQCSITASGGIKSIEDIEALAKMGLYGAICGKSIYAGTLDLAAAIAKGKERF